MESDRDPSGRRRSSQTPGSSFSRGADGRKVKAEIGAREIENLSETELNELLVEILAARDEDEG
jgi:hypothetical protein